MKEERRMSEDRMAFPNTWEEFEKEYGFTDTDEIYTNGSRLIQTFRVRQWLEHLQAEPVIRCKDCKYHYGENACEKDGCYGWYDTDYCSRAERKEE